MRFPRRARTNVFDPTTYEVLNIPRCRVRDTGTGSVWLNALFTNTIFDIADHDTDGMWNGVGRIYFRTTGCYAIGCTIYCPVSAAAIIWQCELRKNGVNVMCCAACSPNSNYEIITASTHCNFLAGEYIEMAVFQNTGANVNATIVGEYAPSMYATFVSST